MFRFPGDSTRRIDVFHSKTNCPFDRRSPQHYSKLRLPQQYIHVPHNAHVALRHAPRHGEGL
jgi:hypothetical protein